MAEKKRIVIPLEQAIELLDVDSKGMVKTFHQIGKERIHAPWRRDDLIEAMAYYCQIFGGVELSGEVARGNHFGLCIHRGDIVKQLPQKIAAKLPLGWLFMATKPGVCCRCGGTGRTAKQAFQILPDRCKDCLGVGTYPKLPEHPFTEELRQHEKKGGA